MSLTVGVSPLMRASILLLHFWMCRNLLIVLTMIFYCQSYGVVDNSLVWHYSSGDLLLAQRGLQSDLDSADFWLQTNQLSLSS